MAELTEVPNLQTHPNPVPVGEIYPIVVFDLETTGLGRHSHILQIGAVTLSGQSFDCYIKPKVPIEWGASQINGLTMDADQIYYFKTPIRGLPLKEALAKFFNFLGEKPVLLVGHNIKSFDCHILVNATKASGFCQEMDKHVAGYLDTLTLFKSTHSSLHSYKQEELYKYFTGSTYEAHNAKLDAQALKEILELASIPLNTMIKFTFKTKYIKDVQMYNEIRNNNFKSWLPLVNSSYISKFLALKAAASGLNINHLHATFRKRGAGGIKSLLSEVTENGKARVTKSNTIIAKIILYFNR